MQVPTVTLDDLQAFQTSHFPGHPPALTPSPIEPVHENDDTYEGEEDLGYYPDGVKRTLTDEQIRIFRHSEVHALLRERQLKQDEAEYEARREKDEDEPRQTIRAEENSMSTVAEAPIAQSSASNRQQSSSRQQSKASSRPIPNTAESEYLDYGETDNESAKKRSNQEPQISHPRRKIISYDD